VPFALDRENSSMMLPRSVVLIAPVRTAIGTFGGSLKEIPAPDLGAIAIKAAVARASFRRGRDGRHG
jgi:acetyl-CoA C-acetyltransferase